MTLIHVGNSEGTVGRCDAKCYDARHPHCDCVCGGRNHGKGLDEAIEREYRTGRQRYETDRYIARILIRCFNVRVIWATTYEKVKGWRKRWDHLSNKHIKVERDVFKQRLVYCLVGEPADR